VVDHELVGPWAELLPHRAAVELRQRLGAAGGIEEPADPNETCIVARDGELADDVHAENFLRVQEVRLEVLDEGGHAARDDLVGAELDELARLSGGV
jgi:hypothetical protein